MESQERANPRKVVGAPQCGRHSGDGDGEFLEVPICLILSFSKRLSYLDKGRKKQIE